MSASLIPEYAHLVFSNTSKSVTSAGTRVQLSTDTTIRSGYIVIQALPANTGKIYVGGTGVTSANGVSLDAKACFVMNAETSKFGNRIFRLSDIYIDSSENGEGVSITYMLEASS